MKNGQSQVPVILLSTAWVISILAGCSWAHAVEEQAVSVDRGVKIPMRDGINLGATIFKPREMQKPLPGIVHFSPYIAEGYSNRARFFARRGYVVALVDVRGRGNSEGQFKPFVHEGRDGHDVVEWLASRPWTNGKVAMFGDPTQAGTSGPRSKSSPRIWRPSSRQSPLIQEPKGYPRIAISTFRT